MGKYRKKPVVVEAFRWTGDQEQTEEPSWILDAIKKGVATVAYPGTTVCCLEIETLEGTHTATRGDYIIQGVKGEIYPCKPDIFELTYEKEE